jgi:hypothetical protein
MPFQLLPVTFAKSCPQRRFIRGRARCGQAGEACLTHQLRAVILLSAPYSPSAEWRRIPPPARPPSRCPGPALRRARPEAATLSRSPRERGLSIRLLRFSRRLLSPDSRAVVARTFRPNASHLKAGRGRRDALPPIRLSKRFGAKCRDPRNERHTLPRGMVSSPELAVLVATDWWARNLATVSTGVVPRLSTGRS